MSLKTVLVRTPGGRYEWVDRERADHLEREGIAYRWPPPGLPARHGKANPEKKEKV